VNPSNDCHQHSLRELLDSFESGSRPKGGVKSIHEGVPSIGGEHLNRNGGFKFEKIKFVPEKFARSMTRGHLRQGDICVVKDGATTGKVSLVRQDFPFSDAVINEHVFRLQVKADHDPAYVFYYLFSAKGQREILSDFRGAAQGGISQAFVDKVIVPVVDRSEQKQIIAEIEKQFTRLDAGVVSLERVQTELKRYRASVLKAACEGRLVPTEAKLAREENRSYETGAQLLRRILKERREKWNGKGKYREPVAPNEDELPNHPEGWTWATVEQISSCLPGSIQSGPFGSQLLHSEFGAAGILAIGIDNIGNGTFSIGKNHRISETKYLKLKKFSARPGDVVITVMATVGRVCVLPADLEPAIITKHCYRITAARSVIPGYLSVGLRADGAPRRHLFDNIRGQTRPGLNGTILKATPIPLPPVEEQYRITSEVERRLTLADSFQQEIETTTRRSSRLRESVLHQAFHRSSCP
jgi:type I restriction enzyme S subunit